jgi:F0F1-type ATP synthase membrane subunit b/b'
MFMRCVPKAGQEDFPVCYEKWNESEQVNKALEKARKEADQMIEKAKPAPRPEPEQETRRETEPEAA